MPANKNIKIDMNDAVAIITLNRPKSLNALSMELIDEFFALDRDYIKDNEIDMLGGPIPIPQENINWDSDKITFEFEVGLTPKYDIKLKFKKPITNYVVKADEIMINEQISIIQE